MAIFNSYVKLPEGISFYQDLEEFVVSIICLVLSVISTVYPMELMTLEANDRSKICPWPGPQLT